MKGNSSPVRSSQNGVHPRLNGIVQKHIEQPWLQPLHRPSVEAFERLSGMYDFNASPIVLDSGCGTGASTRLIANRHPECMVIGVDQSIARLRRQGFDAFPARQGNALFVHAELASFWRLSLQAGWRLARHYLLYPNPWPKPAQVLRRWHGHPVFPQMVALGGVLELRSNWSIYTQEFAAALGQVCPGIEITLEERASEAGWDAIETPFGRKYAQSGHQLYRLIAELPN